MTSPPITPPPLFPMEFRTTSPVFRRFYSLALRTAVAVAVCMAIVVLTSTTASASKLRYSAIVQAVRSARGSIVNIDGHKTISSSTGTFENDSQRVKGMGTGVFIDKRGYILTNYHVVQGVRQINVKLHDGTATIARLVAHDPVTDLAIIKINARNDISLITIGTSKDLMEGEEVIAIGNAYGYQHTVTRGIISALHRSVQVDDKQRYFDLIQTDASINPGNSGGPLLNIDGELIGINVAVRVGAQGIGFAIPVNKAMNVAAQLLSAERLSGVTHGIVTDIAKDASMPGIPTLAETSEPASSAGIQGGDLIVNVNGFPVQRALDLERALIGSTPGQVVPVTVIRQGKTSNYSVKLASVRTQKAPSGVQDVLWHKIGLRLTALDQAELDEYRSMVKGESDSDFEFDGGLRVADVRNGSSAAEQGIRPGDVLVGLHKWKTHNLDNISYVLKEPNVSKRKTITFYIVRDHDTLFGQLPVSWLQ